MKYICFLNHETQKEEIVIFPKIINHDCMAEAMLGVKDQTKGDWQRILRTPVSAGFVNPLQNGSIVCHGRSESLKLDSRPQDTSILLKQFEAF